MAEERATGKVSGWIKAIITSVMGLCSGAVLMYVSPLVNSAIKPAKPVANFSHHAEGLTVTFQNRATGGTDGWWDFGDGSPLEPYSAGQETLTHTYARAVAYHVKLSLHNYLGEENERTVTVDLAAPGAHGPPVIEAFKVVSTKRHITAPATFKLASQIKNADLCILYVGDDRPMEVTSDTSAFERYVTLKEPGRYTLRMVAISGKNTVEKTESVVVEESSVGAPSANLQVTYQAVHIQRTLKEVNLHVAFPADRKEPSYPFKITHTEAEQIAEAKLVSAVKDVGVKSPVLTISPDKTKFVLAGELVKPGGVMALQKNPPPIKWTPTVLLTLERRAEPVLKATDPISLELDVPGVTLLNLPKLNPRWEIKGTMLHLELLDGASVVFKDSKFPTTAKLVQFKNHPYRLTATQETDHIRVELVDAKATLGFDKVTR